MLLDRKKINKWAKIMSAVMAVVFGLSFVALGVGSGTGLNWSDLWNSIGGGSRSQASTSPQGQVQTYEATLQKDPKNVDALLGLANAYKALQQPVTEAKYLELLSEAKPQDPTPLTRLAGVYMSSGARDYASAVRVLNKLTTLDPANADAYLQLGSAERGVGNAQAAILAWSRYLQLQPNSAMSETVKSQLAALQSSLATTTTTAGAATTTTAP